MLPIEQSCYWLANRHKPDLQAQLAEATFAPGKDHKTKVVIIGAGFTGLWTAHYLRQLDSNLDITIVEQGVTGYGASGRNAGVISNCIDHTHGLAITHFGRDEAARLAKIGLKNIEELAQFADDCDYVGSGQLFVALTDKHMDDLRALIEVAQSLNIPGYQLLDADQIRSRLDSPLYLGGAFVPGGGIINPIKLVDRLSQSLTAQGVKILERTKVTALTKSGVSTDRGNITADKTILATDAYSHHLMPGLLWRFIPLYDYILVSQPLSNEELASIGWQGKEAIVDCRTFFNYYRITADNRILWGTSEAMYYAPNQVNEKHDHSEHHYKTLKESFNRHFPQLAKTIEWPYAWGGPIASTTRLTPFFGTAHDGKVLYALGYTGHGIGSTKLAGKVLAHMTLSKNSELLNLKMVKEKPMPYPPEPLRSLSVGMVTGALRKVDQGQNPGVLLKLLDAFGIGFSS